MAWAWARHHNILSWYVRPMLLVPFCFFAYRKSVKGVILSLIALATSMFWFPAPERADPGVEALLDAELAFLQGPWTMAKSALTTLAPFTMIALGLAFWRRSLRFGAVVLNAMFLLKIAWVFLVAPQQGALQTLAPALAGMAACNAAMLLIARLARRTRSAR
jgi:hypothetical protein